MIKKCISLTMFLYLIGMLSVSASAEAELFSDEISLNIIEDSNIEFTDEYTDEIFEDTITEETSNKIDSNISYDFDEESKVLIISGNGYIESNQVYPWSELDFKSVIIEDGIANIPSNAFSGKSITDISIPESVVTIGENAFKDCKDIIRVVMPSNLKDIQSNAFHGCTLLKEVEFTGGLESMHVSAFTGCANLEFINTPAGTVMIF